MHNTKVSFAVANQSIKTDKTMKGSVILAGKAKEQQVSLAALYDSEKS